MVLSFSFPVEADGDDLFSTTNVESVLILLVIFSFLNQLIVELCCDEWICCRRVLELCWWKKKAMFGMGSGICPKRRGRYLKCFKRCERRRQQRRGGDNEEPTTSGGGSSDDCCWSHVSCPFSRAARFYKLHLPAPLPLCGKKERRGSITSLRDPDETSATDTENSAIEQCQSCTSGSTCEQCELVEVKSLSSSSSPTSSNGSHSLVVAPRYQTPLIDLARMQQWAAIRDRGVTRREAKYRDVDGLCALHWACSGGPPVDVVQTLLDAYPSAIKKVDQEGSTPLHFATHYSASPAVVEELLKCYPKAASKRDKYGRSPLFHAVDKSSCLRIWKMLIEADPSMILSPCLPLASLQEPSVPARSAAARTPLFLAWINVISNRHARKTCQGKYWEKAVHLLEAAWVHQYKTSEGAVFLFLPVAVAMDLYLPEQVIALAIQANPEQLEDVETATGLHPIALAASMTHYSPHRGHSMLLQLLQASPKAARLRDPRGRSPLVHAIASGKVWTAGVQALLQADPDSLHAQDRESKLSPALLAASIAAVNDDEEEQDHYDASLMQATSPTSRTSLFLRRHLDPFGFLTDKDHERMDASLKKRSPTSSPAAEGIGTSAHTSTLPPKLDRINTVYELVRADPAAALFPSAPGRLQ